MTAADLVCPGCGSNFTPTRSDAVYCRGACRQRAYRRRRRGPAGGPPRRLERAPTTTPPPRADPVPTPLPEPLEIVLLRDPVRVGERVLDAGRPWRLPRWIVDEIVRLEAGVRV